MDDLEPLLKELRAIRQHLANIDFATNWLLTLAEVVFTCAILFGAFQIARALMSGHF